MWTALAPDLIYLPVSPDCHVASGTEMPIGQGIRGQGWERDCNQLCTAAAPASVGATNPYLCAAPPPPAPGNSGAFTALPASVAAAAAAVAVLI